MMPLFLEPIFHEKIWGGDKLESFGYHLPDKPIGECWCISAHSNGKSKILNGQYAGQTLDQVWTEHRELFGNFPSKEFPLLCKIVDATAPLSIHVHPGDSYAYEHENGQYGKSECLYIIEAAEQAEIVLGTTAQSRAEMAQAIEEQQVESILKRVPVQAGEFYFIPAGTLHSISAGVLAYETMQNSDISYRIYDFKRHRPNQTTPFLNINRALDVIEYGIEVPKLVPESEIIENHKCSHIVSSDFFTMVKWEISGTLNYMKPREFCLVSVLDGEGQMITDGEIYRIQKGSHFILTSEDLDSVFEGDFTLIISYL